MVGSQQDAPAAALCYLRINIKVLGTVASTAKGTPAYGVLHPGDVITAVDGAPADCHHNAVTIIRNRKPGAPVSLTVDRKGVTMTILLVTKKVNGQPVACVGLPPYHVFPFTAT